MKKITLCCALALLLPLAAGCSSTQQKKDADAISASTTATSKAKLVKEDADFEQMSASDLAKYQPDVRISARYEGGHVRVNVRNTTQKAIGIRYSNFCLLLPTQKTTVDPTPGRGFPQVVLQPGEFATGVIEFRDLSNPVGAYCVFQHSQTLPSRCLIRAPKSADTATSTITAKDSTTPVVKKSKALKTTTQQKASKAATSQKKPTPGTQKAAGPGTTTEIQPGYMPNPFAE